MTWPALPYPDWSATCETLNAHTQVLGKLAATLAPPEPQLQHAALRLSARGWQTLPPHEAALAFATALASDACGVCAWDPELAASLWLSPPPPGRAWTRSSFGGSRQGSPPVEADRACELDAVEAGNQPPTSSGSKLASGS